MVYGETGKIGEETAQSVGGMQLPDGRGSRVSTVSYFFFYYFLPISSANGSSY